MSQLSQLKSQVMHLANDVNSTAQAVASFSGKFTAAIASVNASIGGTASNDDKKMIASFQQADEEVKKAVAALRKAADDAQNWAIRA